MLGKLNLIATKAKQDKGLKFTSLVHLINEENLAKCYMELKKDKASGIDGVSVNEYGENLTEKLKFLVQRLKNKSYRPQPVRRVYIPKPGRAEKRGLGIPSVEDKLVQLMVKKILESIYEQDFLDCSYGFRPGRSCHDAVGKLDNEVMTKPINFIVEVDIRKFFDKVQHSWLLRCIEERVLDPNMLWLIRKLLKAGIKEAGVYQPSKLGTPQGGVSSPLFANIYLHYVLDLWFDKIFKPSVSGNVQLIRYCDDFVVCCENEVDAKRFLTELKVRLSKFGLEISPEKTKIIKFGRKPWNQSQMTGGKLDTFVFLGFTHYCAKSRRGNFIMGHKTSQGSMSRKLKEINEWCKKVRNFLCLRDWWAILGLKLRGHYNYYGISGNRRSLDRFHYRVMLLAYKWINRRSQKKSMDRLFYHQYLKWNPLPKPRIYHSIYTLSPR